MKFLIIRFSSIGDIVLTTPVPRCLKKQLPTAEVHFLTKSAFRPVLAGNPYIDKIHLLDDDLEKTIADCIAEDFDYVIDLHHNLRTMKVKRALGKKSYSFAKLNVEKWWLTVFKRNKMPDIHIVDRYMETLAEFGIRNDGAGLDYFIPETDRVREADIPTAHLAGYIGLVIGAALPTKRLPYHKLEELCSTIRHPIVLLGGPEDAATGDKLAAIDPFKIYNACGKFKLNESADLVRRAKLVVTHDTGLMHIAAALRRPVISVWGNTVPDFGMYPYYGSNYLANYGAGTVTDHGRKAERLPYDIVEVNGLSCRPCSKIGYKKCPKGHFKCMETIGMDALAKEIYRRLGR